MSWRAFFKLTAMAGLVFATSGPSSWAENDTNLVRDPTLNRGGFFGSAQNYRNPGAKIIRVPRARPRVVTPAYVPAPRRTAPPATVIVQDQPVLPKVDPTSFIVVIGDSLGELLAKGLEENFVDRPDVAIVQKARSDSGLVRADFHDWPRTVREMLASDQKITLGVMLLGVNDRQAIREGEITHEPMSERWRELYRERIDAVAAAFAEKRVPLVWVGAPPMQNTRLSTDLIALNDMFRQRTERAGGAYVDLWNGFVDGENRYTAMGPDLTGQAARLRANDGIHFTKAGARKAAFFADGPVRRLLAAPAPTNIIALPSTDTGAPTNPELRAGGIERLIDGMVAGLPQASLPVLPVKPIAGPILPLTAPALAREGLLLGSPAIARGRNDATFELERVFAEGIAPEPKPGRADDFRWPKQPN